MNRPGANDPSARGWDVPKHVGGMGRQLLQVPLITGRHRHHVGCCW
jgi:hypothetical protein